MRRAARLASRWLAAIWACLDGMREMTREQAAYLADIANGRQP